MKVSRAMEVTPSGFVCKADWLNDLAKDLLNKYSPMNESTKNKFSSIEEKMNDIKQRIGFEQIQKESSKSCGCNSCKCDINKSASDEKKTHDERDVKLMGVILSYIKEMIKYEHTKDLSVIDVLSKCREEDNLRFNELSIDHDKLKKFIEAEINKYSKKKILHKS